MDDDHGSSAWCEHGADGPRRWLEGLGHIAEHRNGAFGENANDRSGVGIGRANDFISGPEAVGNQTEVKGGRPGGTRYDIRLTGVPAHGVTGLLDEAAKPVEQRVLLERFFQILKFPPLEAVSRAEWGDNRLRPPMESQFRPFVTHRGILPRWTGRATSNFFWRWR